MQLMWKRLMSLFKILLFLFFHRGKFRSSDGRLGNEFLFGGVLDEIR